MANAELGLCGKAGRPGGPPRFQGVAGRVCLFGSDKASPHPGMSACFAMAGLQAVARPSSMMRQINNLTFPGTFFQIKPLTCDDQYRSITNKNRL
jgi:hypothetical protein